MINQSESFVTFIGFIEISFYVNALIVFQNQKHASRKIYKMFSVFYYQDYFFS